MRPPACSVHDVGLIEGRHPPNVSSLIAGWSSLVARRAHNPKVVGSNPTPAIAYLIGTCAQPRVPFSLGNMGVWHQSRRQQNAVRLVVCLGLSVHIREPARSTGGESVSNIGHDGELAGDLHEALRGVGAGGYGGRGGVLIAERAKQDRHELCVIVCLKQPRSSRAAFWPLFFLKRARSACRVRGLLALNTS